MRRTLLDNCENCKYGNYRCRIPCKQCKLYTKLKHMSSDINGANVKNIRTTSKCLQDATDEEVKLRPASTRRKYNARKLQNC